MDKETAKNKIERQLADIANIRSGSTSSAEFKKWRQNTELAIEHVFGKDTRHLSDFTGIRWSPGVFSMGNPDPAFASAYADGLQSAQAVLESMVQEIDEYWDDTKQQFTGNSVTIIENLCNRLHLVARQLRSRYDNRVTIEVEDEYDVQDVMHALLKLTFDDVRSEEWTPSYAGKSARVDFLLKSEQIVIEVKKTRKNLGPKEIGDQLIIDITRYKAHPDCQYLICFVYDPEGRIGNPKSIESDLTGTHDGLDVRVIIAPKGL